MKILVFLNEEDNNAKTKDILWGGATASSQYEGGYKEGGKGLDTQNCRPYLKKHLMLQHLQDYSHRILLMKISPYLKN